jgi:hypothetical protein
VNLLGWALVAVGAFAGAALTDLISEEVRGQLDRLPRAVLRVAACRLPVSHRDEYLEEWNGELHEFLHGAEARPITRLVKGVRFALGLIHAAGTVRQAVGPRGNRIRRERRAIIRAAASTLNRRGVAVFALVNLASAVAGLMAGESIRAATLGVSMVSGLAIVLVTGARVLVVVFKLMQLRMRSQTDADQRVLLPPLDILDVAQKRRRPVLPTTMPRNPQGVRAGLKRRRGEPPA